MNRTIRIFPSFPRGSSDDVLLQEQMQLVASDCATIDEALHGTPLLKFQMSARIGFGSVLWPDLYAFRMGAQNCLVHLDIERCLRHRAIPCSKDSANCFAS